MRGNSYHHFNIGHTKEVIGNDNCRNLYFFAHDGQIVRRAGSHRRQSSGKSRRSMDERTSRKGEKRSYPRRKRKRSLRQRGGKYGSGAGLEAPCIEDRSYRSSYAKSESAIEFETIFGEKLMELRGLAGRNRTQTMEGVLLTKVVEDPTPPTPVYDPTHPDADEDGYYYLPNVDVAEEQIDMLAATQSYTANLTIFNSLKSLANKPLTIGKTS